MKKVYVIVLLLLCVVSFSNVEASSAVSLGNEHDVIAEELENMRLVMSNSDVSLVESFVEYDLHGDIYIKMSDAYEYQPIISEEEEVLALVLYYYENGYFIDSDVLSYAIGIAYQDFSTFRMMATTSTSSWVKYSTVEKWGTKWEGSTLYYVDRVKYKRTVYEKSDWEYDGITSCRIGKPLDALDGDIKYDHYSNCSWGRAKYKRYVRHDIESTEYKTEYPTHFYRSGRYNLPSIAGNLPSISVYGREKFHLLKKIYYDYVMVPYKGDQPNFTVNLYFNNYSYNNEKDNFITSSSLGARAGSLEQTLKYRGTITGNYVGSRYAYTYKNFEFDDGRVVACSNSTCFNTSYYDNLDNEYGNILNGVSSVDVLHTLIANFLFYNDSLGDLFVPTDDYPYVYYGGYVEYNSTWIQYLNKLNEYARTVFYLTEGNVVRGLTKDEHYFRNLVQEGLFPDTLSEFIDLNESIVPTQKWYVYDVEKAIFHMNNYDSIQNSEYNIKLGSYNGCFELVFNTDSGEAINENSDSVNMGTYNYDGFNLAWHTSTDVIPYKQFGNNGEDYGFDLFGTIAETALQISGNITEHENYTAWEENPDAVENYYYYKDLIE